ncbi:MAG: hypothetical protein KZQ64_13355 [gamma proteobacterium symbiont of Bathyaustriella thionipta]|nr:hypothetical protein [gamma proteobacterium symbiont of Bathyaustriella thionipta]MCU7948834.1 hypothetical protein [gamma proteobacterium symbiont of Bathyaustriella thionipta]MCU7954355.1 hypothetical protein [gamma proteobacterium symbiont of Bathyaustriella thionipta]MCU7955292.1 hypothetical protein [gamma proteobacterium symbiont of Bathyaustriella thionipta]MCU7967121.1 hypothetical protein [gamma proteobacterium symbiont of Bathyaustriella thionipta]
MYLLKDFPAFFNDALIIRAVRDLYYSLKNINIYFQHFFEEKSLVLKKESCLQFMLRQQSLNQTSGLDDLKEWVLQRKSLFTEKAFNSGLPLSSGILFMGVSGCGKSMQKTGVVQKQNRLLNQYALMPIRSIACLHRRILVMMQRTWCYWHTP